MAPRQKWRGFWAAAQIRLTTGPTAHVHDLVVIVRHACQAPAPDPGLTEGRIVCEGDPEWRDEVPVRVEVILVRHDDRVIEADETPISLAAAPPADWSWPICKRPPSSSR
ncbi:MAG: histidine kinase N-terminal domain-containing protein [Marmoricola sp.]